MDIEDLYAMIPSFPCIPGCIECCAKFGVPSRTQVEDERLKAYLKAQGRTFGEAKNGRCPYVSEKGCTVYPVRPFTCRIYGSSPNFKCKMGAGPVELLHEDQEEDLFNLYRMHFF